MTEPTEEELKTKLNSKLGGLATALGNRVTKFKGYIDQASSIKTELTLKMMRNHWSRCDDSLSNIEDVIEELDVLDAAGEARREQNRQRYITLLQEQVDRAIEVEKANISASVPQQPAQPAAASAAPTAQQPGVPKANDLLRPESLCLDDLPSTLRNWKRVFTAYYKQQRMNLMSLEEQQMYFSQCLSKKLWDRISGSVISTVPVLPLKSDDGQEEPTSCFSILDEEFRRLYPLVKRRRDVFEYRQGEHQKWTDMSVKLKELAVEAELHTLKFDELLGYLHIMATTDTQLRTKFFQMEEPSLEKMAAKASSFEAAETGMQGLETAQAQTVQRHRQPQHGTRHTENSGGSFQKSPPCHRCDSQKHRASTCPFRSTVCDHCGKLGHIMDACRMLENSQVNQIDVTPKEEEAPD